MPHTLCAEHVAALRHQPEVASKGGVETDLAVQLLAPEDLLLLHPVVLRQPSQQLLAFHN
jgi:hypothetical protein